MTGAGVVAWSPLANGFLSGRYSAGSGDGVRGRLDMLGVAGADPPAWEWRVLERRRSVADELGCGMARVALAWVLGRPRVDAALLGASRPDQVGDSMGALETELSVEQ